MKFEVGKKYKDTSIGNCVECIFSYKDWRILRMYEHDGTPFDGAPFSRRNDDTAFFEEIPDVFELGKTYNLRWNPHMYGKCVFLGRNIDGQSQSVLERPDGSLFFAVNRGHFEEKAGEL